MALPKLRAALDGKGRWRIEVVKRMEDMRAAFNSRCTNTNDSVAIGAALRAIKSALVSRMESEWLARAMPTAPEI